MQSQSGSDEPLIRELQNLTWPCRDLTSEQDIALLVSQRDCQFVVRVDRYRESAWWSSI